MEVFLGTIMMWAPNFAPRGWAYCNGQLLSVAQNTALFSLLGTSYGGDGITTFALPNMSGRVPIAANGHGPGLSPHNLGESGGAENVALLLSQIPAHTHRASLSGQTVQVSSANASASTPVEGARIAVPGVGDGREFTPTFGFDGSGSSNVKLATDSISQGQITVEAIGGGGPVNILQPYIAVNFIIALEGIYPSRN